MNTNEIKTIKEAVMRVKGKETKTQEVRRKLKQSLKDIFVDPKTTEEITNEILKKYIEIENKNG